MKTIKMYVLGTLIVLVAFFGVIELITRTVSWVGGTGFFLALHEQDPTDDGVVGTYQWHPFVGFIFRPGGTVIGSHPRQKAEAHILVDSHGFLALDDTLALAKPANEIRIATIGASTTASLNLDFQDNWPGKLGAMLQQAFPTKRIRVINAGVPGFDTAQSIGNLALRVMPFKPDIVIVYHAYNDMKAVSPNATFRPDYSHIHGTPYGYHEKPGMALRLLNQSMFYVRARNRYREQKIADARLAQLKGQGPARLRIIPLEAEETFDQHVRQLVGIARQGGARIVLSSFATLHDPGLDYRRQETASQLSELQTAELGQLLQFTPGLTLDGILEGFRRYNARLSRIAKDEKTGWVDNAALVPHADAYFVDRVHFSKEGAALMAKNLYPVVLRQLKP